MENTLRGGRWGVRVEMSRLRYLPSYTVDGKLNWYSSYGEQCGDSWTNWKRELPLLLLLGCSVVSDSLWPHELHHARLPYPSSSPGTCSNSYPLTWWCHPPTISNVIPFPCLQSFWASGSFLLRATIWPWKPIAGHILRVKHDPKGCMHPNVHCSTVYNSQDTEAT